MRSLLWLLVAGCASRPLYVPEGSAAPAVDAAGQPDADLAGAPDLGAAPADLSRPSPADAGSDGGTCGLPATVYAGSHEQWFVVSGDFNGDGKLDVVSADHPQAFAERSLLLRYGKGDGTFGDGLLFERPDTFNASALVAADFDGDGLSDVALTSFDDFGSGGLQIWKGRVPDGLVKILDEPRAKEASHGPTGLVAVDLDGDGAPDLLELEEGFLATRHNRGDGSFDAPVETPINGPAQAALTWHQFATGDFNGDGRLDAATIEAHYLGQTPVTIIRMFLGRQDGAFDRGAEVTASGFGTAPEAVDYDGDGKLDLALYGVNPSGTMLLQGRGDGGFVTPSLLADGAGFPATWLDLDGDGVKEQVAPFFGQLATWKRQADGSFQRSQQPMDEDSYYSKTTGDFDGDGRLDLLFAGQFSLTLVSGDVAGLRVHAKMGSAMPTQSVIADVDGDGWLDVVVAYLSDASLQLRHGLGGGRLGPPEELRGNPWSRYLGSVSAEVALGDYTGDGKLDLLLLGYSSGSLLTGSGDGKFAATPLGAGFRVISADLDEDRKLDLLLGGCRLQRGRGDGSFDAVVELGLPCGKALVRDFDADGHVDLFVAGDDGTLRLHRGQGGGGFATTPSWTAAFGAITSPLAADFDGDGLLDVALGDAGLAIFLGNGDGSFTAERRHSLPYTPASLAAADFDGDGKVDVIAGYEKTVGVDFLHGLGDGTLAAPQAFSAGLGIATDQLSVADLDGDGRPDVIGVGFWNNTVTVFRNQLCP